MKHKLLKASFAICVTLFATDAFSACYAKADFGRPLAEVGGLAKADSCQNNTIELLTGITAKHGRRLDKISFYHQKTDGSEMIVHGGYNRTGGSLGGFGLHNRTIKKISATSGKCHPKGGGARVCSIIFELSDGSTHRFGKANGDNWKIVDMPNHNYIGGRIWFADEVDRLLIMSGGNRNL